MTCTLLCARVYASRKYTPQHDHWKDKITLARQLLTLSLYPTLLPSKAREVASRTKTAFDNAER